MSPDRSAPFLPAVAALAMAIFFSMSAAAHPANLVGAILTVKSNGEYRLVVRFDLPALLLNDQPAKVPDEAMRQLLELPDDQFSHELLLGQDRLVQQLKLVAGDLYLKASEIEFPTVSRVRKLATPVVFPVMDEAVLHGLLPAGTGAISVKFPDVLGDVILTIERSGEEPFSEPVSAGGQSSLLPLRMIASAPGASSSIDAHAPVSFARFLQLGFVHILPLGLDHMLFITGLFLLSLKMKPLLWQVTAFTAAHAISLASAMQGAIHPSPAIIEPLIAASIACIAVENLFTRELKPWRPAVVFAFGLVHGLGFAGILLEMHLPAGQVLPSLVSFNIGVELGQIVVLAILFLLAGWFRNATWYRPRIAIPASIAIASIACLWTIKRLIAA